MNNRLQELLTKIKQLEQELLIELQKKEKEYFYEVRDKKVRFQEDVKEKNRRLVKTIRRYLNEASLLNIISVPVIWSCLVPALFLDLVVSLFQVICFPIYSIPKVKRGDYIIFDRQYLSYLNLIEKINCCYCGYFNGLIEYVREISGRTEQYWCPIKHAHRTKSSHSRYRFFLDYGDAEGFRAKNNTIRRDFDDLDSNLP
ncbi:MAG: hypothetical protein KJ804_20850 [Proteobacteria bacterium]|nr:hypothetical protein [Pseudomonadota bacterium]MBU1060758.1 hypothetical protein [Pseudomonadota bacterium]